MILKDFIGPRTTMQLGGVSHGDHGYILRIKRYGIGLVKPQLIHRTGEVVPLTALFNEGDTLSAAVERIKARYLAADAVLTLTPDVQRLIDEERTPA